MILRIVHVISLFLSFGFIAGCGSGSDQPDIAISNVNTATNTNDSQNGDTDCQTECHPFFDVDGAFQGYEVIHFCVGATPQSFFQAECPVATPPLETEEEGGEE